MRVLLVNVTPGSMEEIVFQLARHLKREGVSAIILTYGKGWNNRIVDGIKIYSFRRVTPPSNPLSDYFPRKAFVLDVFINLMKICKVEEINLVHTSFAFPSGYAAALYKKLTGLPYIVTVAGGDVEVVRDIGYGSRLDPVENKLIRIALSSADFVIAPSSYTRSCALQAGANMTRLAVIPFGINTEKIRTTKITKQNVKKMKALLKINSNEKVILSLCRLYPKKGLKYLLYALPKVLEKCENVKLIIIGKGPAEKRLKKIVNDLKLNQKVLFLGFVTEDMKRTITALADVYVLPSLSDSFPMTLLEVMVHKKPIVITTKVGLSDFLQRESFGLLVRPRSSEALAHALVKLLLNDELRLRLGEESLKKAKELSYDKIAKMVLRIYNKVLN